MMINNKIAEEEESTVFEEKPFHDCIDAKACGFKSDLCAKVKSWKEKVDAWKCGAMSSLKERISCLTPKTFVGLVLQINFFSNFIQIDF